MDGVMIACLVISLIVIILGLLLSSSGTSAGLSNISGQDLEIFKKTKDRGFIKLFQIIMFIIMIVIAIILIVSTTI